MPVEQKHEIHTNNDDSMVVEISLKDFKELTNALKKCREEKHKLLDTVEFLNNQIQEYNDKYATNNISKD